jgi:acyl-CoA synthetase (AMP-forming)/AMP-acid ligase II
MDDLLPVDLTAPTMGAMIALSCKWKRDAEFLTDRDDRLTGRATLDAIMRVAGGLAELGVAKGSVVAFLCGSSVRHAVAFFAAQWLGAIPSALHVRDTADRIVSTTDWLDASVLIYDPDFAPVAERVKAETGRKVTLISLGDVQERPAEHCWSDLLDSDPIAMAAVTPEDPAVIILSSGTTGAPKGVVHLHRTLHAASRACHAIYGATEPADSILVCMAPSFAAWVIICVPHLATRARIHFDRSFDPERFLETLSRERITMAPLVPTMWRMVLAADPERFDLPALRCAMFSGEPGTPDLVAAMAARLVPQVRTAYMSSEVCSGSAVVAGPATLIDGGKPSSTGQPVPGADIRVIDPDGDIIDALPDGTAGEILIRSPSVASHYWKDEALSRQKLVDGWWRSGDLGYLDEDGDLFVVGRTDNVINTGGIKVHAEEIEAAVAQHPAVAMVGVIGAPDSTWGQRIEAHVVLSDPSATERDILDFLESRKLLPRNKLPKRIVLRDALPTGPTGKLYRRGLLDPAH